MGSVNNNWHCFIIFKSCEWKKKYDLWKKNKQSSTSANDQQNQ